MKFLTTKLIPAFLALAMVAGVSAPAFAANVLLVREKMIVKGTPSDIWSKIGGFCAISDWHPAVKSCTESNDNGKVLRKLTLSDGGVINEEKTESGDTSYSYTILDGPLPVKHYKAGLSVKKRPGEDGMSMIIWSASFAGEGKTDQEAKAIVESIFKSGMESIKAKLASK